MTCTAPLLHQTTYLRLLFATLVIPKGDPHGASIFSVSRGSVGNLSYNSVSCAPISPELRHCGVFDGTHCSADVCCRWFSGGGGHTFPSADPTEAALLAIRISRCRVPSQTRCSAAWFVDVWEGKRRFQDPSYTSSTIVTCITGHTEGRPACRLDLFGFMWFRTETCPIMCV